MFPRSYKNPALYITDMYSLILTQTLPIQYTYFKFDNILIIRILSIYVYTIYIYTVYMHYNLYIAILFDIQSNRQYMTQYTLLLFDIHLNYF